MFTKICSNRCALLSFRYELELDGPPLLEWFRGRVRRHAEGFNPVAATGLDVVTTVALFGPPLALLCLFLAIPYVVTALSVCSFTASSANSARGQCL